MDAFRALLGCACSPTAVASDPEAQPQHSYPLSRDCARSTITVPTFIPTLILYRGTVYSRHDDDPPPPSLLPCPDDTPPAYTYPPPSLPMHGSDDSATHETMIGHNLYPTVVAVMLTVVLFATAVYFSFLHHSKM